MNTHDFSQDILARIESEHIAPRSRFVVLVRRGLWYGLAGVMVIAGGTAFATILFFAREQEWREVVSMNMLENMHIIPLVWIGAFLLFACLTLIDVRALPRGYRYETGMVLLLVMMASMAVGMGVYAVGLEEAPHTALGRAVPAYRELFPDPALAWHRPQAGRYVGIVSATSSQGFILTGRGGNEWRISVATSSRLLPFRVIDVGIPIRTVCTSTNEGDLVLLEARPWRKRLAPFERSRP